MLSERKDLASQPIWCLSCVSSSNPQSSPDSEAVSVSDVGSDTSCKPYSNQHSQLLFWGHRARDFRSFPWGLNGASPRADIYDYKLFCASTELQNLTVRGTCMFSIWCVCVWYMHACMLSRFNRIWLFVTLWTVAHQAPLSMGFSSQEYWTGLPCPPPKDRPNPGIEPASPVTPALQVDSLPLSHWGNLVYI